MTSLAQVAASRAKSKSQQLMEALDSLPTLPVVAIQIGEVIHSRSASVQQVAELLRADPATSAKLLRLVNSPYFGVPGGISDVARAIPFVGFNTLYQLVLTISVIDTLKPANGGGGVDPRSLWVHALGVATAARELAQDLRFSDPGSCFTAGLLHDMGKIALAKLDPTRLASALEATRTEKIGLAEAEVRFDLPAHDAIGSRLAKLWRFPATLATPIEQHHAIHRVDVRDRLAPNLRTISEIVCVADAVAERCTSTFVKGAPSGDEGLPGSDSIVIERNGFGDAALEALCDRTKKELERSRVFLSLLD